MGLKPLGSVCRFALINVMLLALWMLFPVVALANYSVGLVGIESRIQSVQGTNLDNYTNLDNTRDPIDYAQGIFSEIFTVELPNMGMDAVDISSRVEQARRDEMCFQLKMGKPEKVIQNFTVRPEYMIYGYITNFTITHRETMWTNNISVEVNLTARVIDANDGQVVFVATGKGISSTHNTTAAKGFRFGGEEISEECWHDALEKSLMQIVEKMKKAV